MRPVFCFVDFREAALAFFDFAGRLNFLSSLAGAEAAVAGSTADGALLTMSFPADLDVRPAAGEGGNAGIGSGDFLTTDTFAGSEGRTAWSCGSPPAWHMKATVPDLSLSVWLSQAAIAQPGMQSSTMMDKPVLFTPLLLRLARNDAATRKTPDGRGL